MIVDFIDLLLTPLNQYFINIPLSLLAPPLLFFSFSPAPLPQSLHPPVTHPSLHSSSTYIHTYTGTYYLKYFSYCTCKYVF